MRIANIKYLFVYVVALFVITSCNDQNMVQNTPPQSDNQGSVISKSQKQTQFDKPKIIKGEYIVKFKNQFDGRISENIAVEVSELRNQVLSTFNIQQDSIIAEYNYAFKGFAAKLSDEQVQALKKDSRIARITPNALFKLATVSSKKTFVNTPFMNQTIPWGVNRVGGPLDGTGKKAWILDTGIDLDNSDLNVDINNSASFIATENADDQVGHGTHVAGIIAAKNNSIDVVGVAAGATVVAVKVCNNLPLEDPESGCPASSIINGINHVSSNAQSDDIVNMSLGGYDPFGVYTDIDDAVSNTADEGIRFTISAGNASADASDFTPARVEHSNVWTVSGYDSNDNWYVNSNYGNPPIEYGGPAVNVPSLDVGGGIINMTGTSMAAPHIAGLLLTVPNNISVDGYVNNDPDNTPDPIAAYIYMEVNISGLGLLVEGGPPATYTANVSGGDSPYDYQWYEDGSPVGTNSSTHDLTPSSAGQVELKVVVTDDNNITAEDDMTVNISPPK